MIVLMARNRSTASTEPLPAEIIFLRTLSM